MIECCGSGWPSAIVAARILAHVLIRDDLVDRLSMTVIDGRADWLANRLLVGLFCRVPAWGVA